VAVIGSGGISHWVGTAEMGRVNERFDREILGYALRNDLAGLSNLSDAYILENGGNGGMEIRNWACAMGVLEGAEGEIIAYEAVPEWVTGLGFVQLHPHGRREEH
jgi:protocatechuate 4,5-dioxygenase beta chain